MSTEASPAPEAAPRPAVRGRWWIAGLVVVVALAAGAFAAYRYWPREPDLYPIPEPALEGVEARVAEGIRGQLDRVRQSPRDGEAWGRLGVVLYLHHYYREAMNCFANAEALGNHDPRWPYYIAIYQGHNDTALVRRSFDLAVSRAEAVDPAKANGVRLRYAEFLIGENDLSAAEQQLEAVAARAPDDPHLRFCRGLIACRRHQWRQARELLLPLQADSPVPRQLAGLLATVHQRLGEHALAEAISRQAPKKGDDPGWGDPYLSDQAGLTFNQQAQFRELEALEESKDAAAVLGKLRELLAESKGKDHLIYFALGTNLRRTGQLEAAESAYRKALALAPNRYRTVYLLSTVLHDQGDAARQAKDEARAKERYEAALALARRATELSPTDAWGHFQVGRSLHALGKRDEALPHLRKGVNIRPEVYGMQLHLGTALAERGDKEGALLHLRRAVELAPAHDKAPAEALAKYTRLWGIKGP